MKIFGIGLNKTGTTTLGVCLRQLGFRHSSFSLEFFEQLVLGEWQPFLQHVDQHDSFEDWPYALFFEQLDQHFPGSRFILTRRSSPARWLESLRAHALRTDPRVGTRTRSLAYGFPYPQLNSEAHLQFYEQHLQRVRSYFAGRPNDLLEVCWEEQPAWESLCTFLRQPVPGLPFPHANARFPAKPEIERQNQAQLAWFERSRFARLTMASGQHD